MKLRQVVYAAMMTVSLAASAGYKDGVAAYEKKDDRTALEHLVPFADNGDLQSQVFLASIYTRNHGVSPEPAEATKWCKLAAEQGDAQSIRCVAQAYALGKGVDQDLTKALKWYQILADKGEVIGQEVVGTYYYRGTGVEQDYKEAAKWFNLALKQNSAIAQVSLGHMYREGSGVLQDYKESVRLFALAADQGDPWGIFNLAIMYYNGKGVKPDDVITYALLNYSIAQWKGAGRVGPTSLRDSLTERMSKEKIDQAQSLSREFTRTHGVNKAIAGYRS